MNKKLALNIIENLRDNHLEFIKIIQEDKEKGIFKYLGDIEILYRNIEAFDFIIKYLRKGGIHNVK